MTRSSRGQRDPAFRARGGVLQGLRGGVATLESGLYSVYRVIWRKCSRWVHRVRNSIPFVFFISCCNMYLCGNIRLRSRRRLGCHDTRLRPLARGPRDPSAASVHSAHLQDHWLKSTSFAIPEINFFRLQYRIYCKYHCTVKQQVY
jgi:hypothetical protein